MSMSPTLNQFLSQFNIAFDTLQHKHVYSAIDAARSAGVPMKQMAKAVVLEDEAGNFMMAVVPAMNKLDMRAINRRMGQTMRLVNEIDLKNIFQDCEMGAIPVFGQAFGMKVMVDDVLLRQPDVYVEAGDHEQLLHVNQQQFKTLMSSMPHDFISG